MYLQGHSPLSHSLFEDSGPLLPYLPQSSRLRYVHLKHVYTFSILSSYDKLLTVFFFLPPHFLVIEVASGEYGDLNPVLFEAVQRGMCALEEKKNQSDSSNSSVCATMRPVVCIFLLKYNPDHIEKMKCSSTNYQRNEARGYKP